jgi:methionyl-tRNA synthetase
MHYYITSPIYYVNDKPHIGHAYTTIICDIVARFKRLSGAKVMFMTGIDEHGQKIQRSAEKAGIKSKDFVDGMAQIFQKLARDLNASNDVFLRTTSLKHKKAVEILWSKLLENGDIYLGKYSGWYSIRDEAFYEEHELNDEKLAPSGSPVEWVEEPCYFFALSKWQQPLLEFYDRNSDFVKPDYRFNEVISFVKSGLKDLAVSRSGVSWGIPVPGDEKHVIYVWLDALTSYLSAIDFFDKSLDTSKYWPVNAHIVGKDILRFHAIYWPAFLMALGIALPKHIVAHGWWTNEGQKISKSLGNVIDPTELIEEFGVEYLRYFLVREITFGSDGNFVRDNLVSRVNHELNNKVGNLCQRVLSFIYDKLDGKLDAASLLDKIYEKNELLLAATNMANSFDGYISDFAIHLMLDSIINLADDANRYIDLQAPWKLVKIDSKKAGEVLLTLVETIRYIGISLLPFIPVYANKILDQLDIPSDLRVFAALNKNFALKDFKIKQRPEPIFNRI